MNLEAELQDLPRGGYDLNPFDIPSELEGKVSIRRRGSDTIIDIPSDVFFSSGLPGSMRF